MLTQRLKIPLVILMVASVFGITAPVYAQPRPPRPPLSRRPASKRPANSRSSAPPGTQPPTCWVRVAT
jgi:hypothetical protein